MVLFGLDSSVFAPSSGDSAFFGSVSANSAICFLILVSAISDLNYNLLKFCSVKKFDI